MRRSKKRKRRKEESPNFDDGEEREYEQEMNFTGADTQAQRKATRAEITGEK